jgi:hypothetical protein
MTPAELTAWRKQRFGPAREAASWYGVTLRQWQRYEGGESGIRAPLVHRIEEYERTLDGPGFAGTQ